MTKYIAYTRVSTKKQEDKDNSLPAQKRIIVDYAKRKKFEVVKLYSEAKSGYKGKRGEFYKMIDHLKSPEIEGVIFHKLDRSARNIKDFSVLDRLMSQGKKIAVIEGEFDTSRAAGRLAFRNFCNLCVWYSENLSEEVTTKMEEALMKGYYPTQNPIGYRKGIKKVDDDWKKKYPDSAVAPYVKESFKLMATGNYSIRSLCEYMRKQGMRNSNGGELRKGVFERMLRNPFYHGLIVWKRKNKKGEAIYYEGNHEALITKKLFTKVQDILDNRVQRGETKHNHTYSKLVRCKCGNFLISSMHKDRVYLKCQNTECDFTSIREDRFEDQLIINLSQYQLADDFLRYSQQAIDKLTKTVREDNKEKRKALNLKLAKIDGKLDKLKQAVLGGFFSPEDGIAEKNKLVEERHTLRRELADVEDKQEESLWKVTLDVIKIFNYIPYRYKELNSLLKRKFINYIFSNLQLDGSKLLAQVVPALERIQISNNLIKAQKTISNLQPNGSKTLNKDLPQIEEGLQSLDFPNGRGGRTRTCGLTVPNRAL